MKHCTVTTTFRKNEGTFLVEDESRKSLLGKLKHNSKHCRLNDHADKVVTNSEFQLHVNTFLFYNSIFHYFTLYARMFRDHMLTLLNFHRSIDRLIVYFRIKISFGKISTSLTSAPDWSSYSSEVILGLYPKILTKRVHMHLDINVTADQ